MLKNIYCRSDKSYFKMKTFNSPPPNKNNKIMCRNDWLPIAGLSISFEVDIPIGKVGGGLLFERWEREFPRGVWGHAPPENFEI